MSRIKGLFVACAVLSFLGLSLLLVLQSWPQSIPWERDYQKALQQARKEKKPLVAYLFTDWCTYCQQMERETFSDVSLIRKIGQEYVWLKLNAETDQEGQRLQQEFGISGYPTTFVLDSKGQEVDRVAGYLPPRKFEEKLHHLVNNPDSFGKVLQRAESEPQSTEAQYHLAERYLQRQNFEQAVLRFSRVIELDPENDLGMMEASQFYLAISLASQNKKEEAFRQIARLEKMFPESKYLPDATLLQGQLHSFSGDHAKARQILSHFLKTYPDHLYTQQIRSMLDEIDLEQRMSKVE